MLDRRRRRRSANRFGGPLAQAAVVAAALAALGLLVFTTGASWVDKARSALDDALAPVQQVAAAPFAAIRQAGQALADHAAVYEENRRLKAENAELRRWYELALAMRDKMGRYEKLLALNPDPVADVVTARVVAETNGPFVRGRLINAGAANKVALDQAVLSEHGLVGRVVAVGARSSRVLLLSDINSRIPVMAERNDARAILAGDNEAAPRLLFLQRGHGLRDGDRIVTSGDGGQMPRGLPVGAAFTDEAGAWRVRLFADDAPIDYVRVVRFEFPPPPEAEPAAAPAVDEAVPAKPAAEAAAQPGVAGGAG